MIHISFADFARRHWGQFSHSISLFMLAQSALLQLRTLPTQDCIMP
jgi:hypothetical protein